MAIYREIVERKKLPVILKLFIILTIVIYISDFLGKFMIGTYSLRRASKFFFAFVMLIIIIQELKKCVIKYRYSVIEDELIIHKLNGNDEKIVEDIKFKDIKFIGTPKDKNIKFDVEKSKNYIASMFSFEKYCCIYKEGDKFKKFYFEPSNKLLKNIKKSIKYNKSNK